MSEGKLTNFKEFYSKSQVFTAVADEPEQLKLDPWIQWYSMHTGLPVQEHRVRNLTDGPKAGHDDIWQMLMRRGIGVGNCSSMNAKAIASPGSFYVPDPWCTTEKPYPEELEAFHRVVRNRVQENSTGSDGCLSKGDYLKFLTFLATHGISAGTIAAITGQLWSDSVKKQDTAWKRVPLLDKMQMDVFLHYWDKFQPAFSTFFLNSTAHYQHAYWHYTFPELYPGRVDEEGLKKFGNAILFGYQEMDKLLGRFLELESRGVMLILSTALSQFADTAALRNYYRPRNVEQMLESVGIRCEQVLPVMSEQFSARFANAAQTEDAKTKLSALHFLGKRLFDFGRAPENHLFFGCNIQTEVARDAVIDEWPGGGRKFFEIFSKIPHTRSGQHHPDSVLWFKTGDHRVHEGRVSILDVLPTIMSHFGVPRDDYDPQRRLPGRDLLPVMAGVETVTGSHRNHSHDPLLVSSRATLKNYVAAGGPLRRV